ncbi:MAG: hypothetical protein HOI47_31070 [Candidatus Scalindua sp.]|mgnify:FL=1|jgi:hypothetical protein|nr:hypothetical protein [Candidatus Scalindua sp.]
MLRADLENKLTQSELTSEDFLTSSVFSVFRFVNCRWLNKYINQAVNINGESLDVNLDNPSYGFWPWYSTEKYGKGAEPDVVISSGDTALIIEAKNYSGKSGIGVITENDPSNTEGVRKVIIDQLGREYFVGQKRLLNSAGVKHFYVIYLTRHDSFPKDDIEESIESIKETEPKEYENSKNLIYWLNWQKVIPVFEELIESSNKSSMEYKISSELIEFLDKRNLRSFSGFKYLKNYKSILDNETKMAESLFYKEVLSKYWECLNKYKLFNKKNNYLFFSESKVLYWNFLDEYKLLNTKSYKHIFFKG